VNPESDENAEFIYSTLEGENIVDKYYYVERRKTDIKMCFRVLKNRHASILTDIWARKKRVSREPKSGLKTHRACVYRF
jgi:hypothetical protein